VRGRRSFVVERLSGVWNATQMRNCARWRYPFGEPIKAVRYDIAGVLLLLRCTSDRRSGIPLGRRFWGNSMHGMVRGGGSGTNMPDEIFRPFFRDCRRGGFRRCYGQEILVRAAQEVSPGSKLRIRLHLREKAFCWLKLGGTIGRSRFFDAQIDGALKLVVPSARMEDCGFLPPSSGAGCEGVGWQVATPTANARAREREDLTALLHHHEPTASGFAR